MMYMRSLKMTFVAALLLLSFIATPFSANAADQATLDQLANLKENIIIITDIIVNSPEMTISERQRLLSRLYTIEKSILYLEVLVSDSPTIMEVVTFPEESLAKAQIITIDGIVELDFFFSPGVLDVLPQDEIVYEVVSRTSRALNVSWRLLNQGAVMVSEFTGTLEMPGLDVPDVPDAPVVTEPKRTNVQSIDVTGSLEDFSVRASVVFGAENVPVTDEFLPGTVKSFGYEYEVSDTDLDVHERLTEFHQNWLADLAVDLDKPAYEIHELSTISIERFADASAVSAALKSPLDGIKLLGHFGTYSIIKDVDIFVGANNGYGNVGNGTVVYAWTDQDEEIYFNLSSYEGPCDGDDACSPDTEHRYRFEYKIHDVLVTSAAEDGLTYSEVVAALRRELKGLGSVFGVSDAVITSELARFMVTNKTFFADTPLIMGSNTGILGADVCITSQTDEDIIHKGIAYYARGLQLRREIDIIGGLGPMFIDRVIGGNDEEELIGCSIDTTYYFFPSQKDWPTQPSDSDTGD